MLTDRYLASTKNLGPVLEQIVRGTAPQNFNVEHLVGLGFTSSNDRGIVPLLKTLGFLTDSGQPTPRYHAYRAGGAQAKAVMGEALLEAYDDLFTINANPTDKDREAIQGKFKSAHNATDRVAEAQAATFFALLRHADLDGARAGGTLKQRVGGSGNEGEAEQNGRSNGQSKSIPIPLNLRYMIEVHLPATKEIEVYNAIFKSMRENLID